MNTPQLRVRDYKLPVDIPEERHPMVAWSTKPMWREHLLQHEQLAGLGIIFQGNFHCISCPVIKTKFLKASETGVEPRMSVLGPLGDIVDDIKLVLFDLLTVTADV